jgi:hypothetical protein
MTDTVEITTVETVTVESVVVEVVEVAVQGPPGPQGNHGFTTSVDVISGGTADTNYTNGFVFSGGGA